MFGALVVFALSLAVLLTVFGLDYSPLQADETSLAWQAKLARDGYLPYRDYFAFKPPLIIYLPAAVFALFGSSLGVLRLFAVAVLAATAVTLFLLGVRARLGVAWAACAALVLPAILVPYWPLPSAQWMALLFGLAGMLCVASPRPGVLPAFAAGALAALAGLCVQTHGPLFAGLLAISLVTDSEARTLRTFTAAAAGIATPLLLAVFALWYAGILPEALQHVVLWPLQYYKQPGGFNDGAAAADAGGGIAWSPRVLFGIAQLLVAVSLPFIATASSMLLWRRGVRGPRGQLALGGCVLLSVVYMGGRADHVHLAFLAPVFLYLGVQHLGQRGEAHRVLLLHGWLVLAAVAMLQWPIRWIAQPPSVAAVQAVDAAWRERGLPRLPSELPGVERNDLPVLFVSLAGSALYFYWAPSPPPVDWLHPPVDRYNSPAEYQATAEFADERAVPYIVIPAATEALWLQDASPIRDLLAERYRRAFETSWGVAYCRIGSRLPRTGEVVCDLPPVGAPHGR